MGSLQLVSSSRDFSKTDATHFEELNAIETQLNLWNQTLQAGALHRSALETKITEQLVGMNMKISTALADIHLQLQKLNDSRAREQSVFDSHRSVSQSSSTLDSGNVFFFENFSPTPGVQSREVTTLSTPNSQQLDELSNTSIVIHGPVVEEPLVEDDRALGAATFDNLSSRATQQLVMVKSVLEGSVATAEAVEDEKDEVDATEAAPRDIDLVIPFVQQFKRKHKTYLRCGLNYSEAPMRKDGIGVQCLNDGDVLVFPKMTGKPWQPGVHKKLNGSFVFVCSHNERDRRGGVCGSPLIEKFKADLQFPNSVDPVLVTACSHIGRHKYAGNVIIFSTWPLVDGDAVVTINFCDVFTVMFAMALEFETFNKFDGVRVPKFCYAGMLQHEVQKLEEPGHVLTSWDSGVSIVLQNSGFSKIINAQVYELSAISYAGAIYSLLSFGQVLGTLTNSFWLIMSSLYATNKLHSAMLNFSLRESFVETNLVVLTERLKAYVSSLSRQVDTSELEMQALRKQIKKERKRGEELSREVGSLKEESDTWNEECKHLKCWIRTAMFFHEMDFVEELKQELHHAKELNVNLSVQFQKSQESNSTLILAVRDLEEILEQNKILTAVVQGMNANEGNIDVSLASTRALYNALGFAQANFSNDMERDYIMRVVCEATLSPEVKIRRAAFECLVLIGSTYYEKLAPYIQDIFNITSKAVRDDDEPVALQAIEFWSSICDDEIDILEEYGGDFTADSDVPCYYFIKQALPALVPLLLEMLLKQEEDQDQDVGAWNLAIAGGTCLGLVARTVGDHIVPLVMPFIEENITKADWRQREGATYAFGSILEGPSLDKLTPIVNVALSFVLTALTKDPSSYVKDTTAWTLGRIFEFLHGSTVVTPIITPANCQQIITFLLQSMNDAPNVAEKACGALYFLAQGYEDVVSTSPLTPYFQAIVQPLLHVTHREDAGESRLRTAAYETLNEVVRSSTAETGRLVVELVQVIMTELHKTLEAQKLSFDEREKQTELQGFILTRSANTMMLPCGGAFDPRGRGSSSGGGIVMAHEGGEMEKLKEEEMCRLGLWILSILRKKEEVESSTKFKKEVLLKKEELLKKKKKILSNQFFVLTAVIFKNY